MKLTYEVPEGATLSQVVVEEGIEGALKQLEGTGYSDPFEKAKRFVDNHQELREAELDELLGRARSQGNVALSLIRLGHEVVTPEEADDTLARR